LYKNVKAKALSALAAKCIEDSSRLFGYLISAPYL